MEAPERLQGIDGFSKRDQKNSWKLLKGYKGNNPGFSRWKFNYTLIPWLQIRDTFLTRQGEKKKNRTYINTCNPPILKRRLLFSAILVFRIRFGRRRSHNTGSIISTILFCRIRYGWRRSHNTGSTSSAITVRRIKGKAGSHDTDSARLMLGAFRITTVIWPGNFKLEILSYM